MPIEPLTASQEAELRRINHKFMDDLDRLMRRSGAGEDEIDMAIRAYITGIEMAGQDAAEELLDLEKKPWKPE